MENNRFAGLVQVGGVSLMPDARWHSMQVPRVAISKPPNYPQLASLPSFRVDWMSFHTKAVDWLQSRGRKRIAVVATDLSPQKNLCELIRDRGLLTKSAWHQVGSLHFPEAVGHVTQLLTDPTLGEKPDAIIITDDNMVEPALGGLLASGVRVGADLDVIAHCSWPRPVPTVPQVRRLGFDAGEILTAALDALDAQREGKQIPLERMIAARFEDELASLAFTSGAESES